MRNRYQVIFESNWTVKLFLSQIRLWNNFKVEFNGQIHFFESFSIDIWSLNNCWVTFDCKISKSNLIVVVIFEWFGCGNNLLVKLDWENNFWVTFDWKITIESHSISKQFLIKILWSNHYWVKCDCQIIFKWYSISK